MSQSESDLMAFVQDVRRELRELEKDYNLQDLNMLDSLFMDSIYEYQIQPKKYIPKQCAWIAAILCKIYNKRRRK